MVMRQGEEAKAITSLVELAETDDTRYFEIVQAIARILPTRLVEQLTQLVNGPVYDGDVINKRHRGELFDMGLAIRVCSAGQQGYTGATYTAYSVLKRLQQMKQEK